MSGDVDAAPDSAVEDGTDADFEAGFGGAAVTGATETPAPAPQDADQPQASDSPAAAPAPAETPAPAAPELPKYVQITEAELAELRSKADRGAASSEQVAQTRSALDKAFGKIGALEQVITKLRADTPAGEKVEISEEDFGELAQEYPEIAKLQLKGLNKALEKLRGTGDPKALEEIGQRVESVRTENRAQSTETMLNAVLPDWRAEVNKPEFAQWLQAQPKDVQDMQMSDDPLVAARMLRLYDRHLLKSLFQPPAAPAPAPASTPAPQRATTRQRQLAAAVPPKGDGAATPTSQKEEDPFEVGFRTGRS